MKVIEVHLSAVFPCEPLGCCHRWLPEVSRGGEEVVLFSVYIICNHLYFTKITLFGLSAITMTK